MKEPLKITGAITYELEITNEGYSLKHSSAPKDNIAALLIAKEIAETKEKEAMSLLQMEYKGKDTVRLKAAITEFKRVYKTLTREAVIMIRTIMKLAEKEFEKQNEKDSH